MNNDFESENENDDQKENSDEEIDEELHSFFNDEKLSREELAASFLAAFYDGADKQKSLANYLKINNFSNKDSNLNKIPTTLSRITKLLDKDNEPLTHKTIWYCSTCYKKFDELTSRLQRVCSECNTNR